MYMKYNVQNNCSYPIEEKAFENICDNIRPNYSMLNDCDCGFDEKESEFTILPTFGFTYVPRQKLAQTFTPCEGLRMGTIFPELVSPYRPGQSMEEIQYLRERNEIGEGCNSGHI